MKKILLVLLVCILCLVAVANQGENEIYELAEKISGEMEGEPFVVKVVYGELLLKGETKATKRKEPTKSDMRAAAAAYCNLGFGGETIYVTKWRKAKNTPLEMRSGVHLYEWFFYR